MKLERLMSFSKWLKGYGGLEISWNNYGQVFSIIDFRGIRKENKLEYPNDPDVNVKRQWGIHTNGAVKGNKNHKCLDWTLSLGHIEFNYINFEYNKNLK